MTVVVGSGVSVTLGVHGPEYGTWRQLNRATGKEISTMQSQSCAPVGGTAGKNPNARFISSDYVRQQGAFDLRDFVLQLQLAFLQPLQLELVEGNLLGDPRDNVVEVAVLAPELAQPSFQDFLIDRIVHHPFLNLVAGPNSS